MTRPMLGLVKHISIIFLFIVLAHKCPDVECNHLLYQFILLLLQICICINDSLTWTGLQEYHFWKLVPELGVLKILKTDCFKISKRGRSQIWNTLLVRVPRVVYLFKVVGQWSRSQYQKKQWFLHTWLQIWGISGQHVLVFVFIMEKNQRFPCFFKVNKMYSITCLKHRLTVYYHKILHIQWSATITRSNITFYCIQRCSDCHTT